MHLASMVTIAQLVLLALMLKHALEMVIALTASLEMDLAFATKVLPGMCASAPTVCATSTVL